MKYRLLKLTSAIIVFALLVQASMLSVHAADTYIPQTGALFNNPLGPSPDIYKISGHVNRAIDNTPAGETIRIATFRFTLNSTYNALLRAYERGVHVRVIVGGSLINISLDDELATIIGTDTSKSSFVIHCEYACNSSQPSTIMHAKFMLFSKVAATDKVAMVTSGNLTDYQTTVGSNDMYSTNGNVALYNALRKHFDELTTDTDYTGPLQQISMKKHRLILSPANANSVKGTKDPITSYLNKIKCNVKPKSGYGRYGKTVVELSVSSWGSNRFDVANQLNNMSKNGCIVRVMLGHDHGVNEALYKRLLQNGSRVVVKDSVITDVDGKPLRYAHSKYFLVNGSYGTSRGKKVVLMGSTNLWKSNGYTSDDLMLLIDRPYIHSQYSSWFTKMFRESKRIHL